MDGHAEPITLKVSGNGQAVNLPETAKTERTKKALLAKDKALLNGKSEFELSIHKTFLIAN